MWFGEDMNHGQKKRQLSKKLELSYVVELEGFEPSSGNGIAMPSTCL